MIPEVAMNLEKDMFLISSSEKSLRTLILFNFRKSGQNIMFRKKLKDNIFCSIFGRQGEIVLYVQKKVKGQQFCSISRTRAKLYHIQKYIKEH